MCDPNASEEITFYTLHSLYSGRDRHIIRKISPLLLANASRPAVSKLIASTPPRIADLWSELSLQTRQLIRVCLCGAQDLDTLGQESSGRWLKKKKLLSVGVKYIFLGLSASEVSRRAPLSHSSLNGAPSEPSSRSHQGRGPEGV